MKQHLVVVIIDTTCKALNASPEKVQIIISDVLPESYVVSSMLKIKSTTAQVR